MRKETQKEDTSSGAAAPKTTEELLAEGKRCLAAEDANGAVERFQEVCALLAEEHGQLARELAEPYYLYGKALLEVSRGESTVLGSGIPVPEEQPSSDEDENHEDVQDSPSGAEAKSSETPPAEQTTSSDAPGPSSASGDAPGPSSASGDAPGPSSASGDAPGPSSTSGNAPGPSSASGNAPGPSSASGDAPGPSSASGDAPGPSSGSGDAPGPSSGSSDAPGPSGVGEGEGEEEESDLKLAWEVLELARVICQKQEGREFKLKLADVNLALGEVGLESDQCDQAIGDLRTCLQLRQEALEPTDRRLAEVHFSLGLAYTLAKEPDNSIEEYMKAKEVLEKRTEKLQQQDMAGKSEAECSAHREELEDLQSLLPDLDSKITDAKEIKKMIAERAKEEGEGSSSVGFGDAGPTAVDVARTVEVKKAPVSDISHLVRKRRAEDSGETEKPAKRPCPPESNGDIETSAETLTGQAPDQMAEQ